MTEKIQPPLDKDLVYLGDCTAYINGEQLKTTLPKSCLKNGIVDKTKLRVFKHQVLGFVLQPIPAVEGAPI